ncbi:aspartate aminotransferase family protein, partial [Flavobacterium sp. IR1]
RLDIGGAQELYEVQPDLTTLGKVIGGGFPVGVVGGRKGILNITSPSNSAGVFYNNHSQTSNASDVLFHSGTYTGHTTIFACGLATLEVLKKEATDVCNLTNELKTELEHLFKQYSIPMLAVGEGSIFNIVITDKKNISHYRDLQASDFKLRKKMDLRLLLEGIYTKPLNRYSVSTAHTA